MPLTSTEAEFLCTGLPDSGASIVDSALKKGDPFWRTMLDADWLDYVRKHGNDLDLEEPLADLPMANKVSDAVEFLKKTEAVLGSHRYAKLICGGASFMETYSMPMTWISRLSRIDGDKKSKILEAVLVLIDSVAHVPGILDASIKAKISIDDSRTRMEGKKFEAEQNALTLALTGNLKIERHKASSPGDDDSVNARVARRLIEQGAKPDAAVARMLFKVMTPEDGLQWCSWISQQRNGGPFLEALLKHAARLQPDKTMVSTCRAMLAKNAMMDIANQAKMQLIQPMQPA